MKYIMIPNLEKWQHYKDRNPPWIKLHRDLLNDYKYSCLQDASKLHLIMIWLLASQMDNCIPYDPVWIRRRINATEKVDLEILLKHGFIKFDSKTLASCKQSAMRETETETETEKDIGGKKSRKFQKPTIEEIAQYCVIRNNGIDAEEFWHFYDSKNWMIGKNKMTSWKSAVITWEKNNHNFNGRQQTSVISNAEETRKYFRDKGLR